MTSTDFINETEKKLANIQKKYECQNIIQIANCALGYRKDRGFISLREWRTFLIEFCGIPAGNPLNCPDEIGFQDPDSRYIY